MKTTFLLMALSTLLLSGCVKNNENMPSTQNETIKNDKNGHSQAHESVVSIPHD